MRGHLACQKTQKCLHDRIALFILQLWRLLTRGHDRHQHLPWCQHGAAYLTKKLRVGLEQGCIKPETIGIADGSALAAKRLVVHHSLRKYK